MKSDSWSAEVGIGRWDWQLHGQVREKERFDFVRSPEILLSREASAFWILNLLHVKQLAAPLSLCVSRESSWTGMSLTGGRAYLLQDFPGHLNSVTARSSTAWLFIIQPIWIHATFSKSTTRPGTLVWSRLHLKGFPLLCDLCYLALEGSFNKRCLFSLNLFKFIITKSLLSVIDTPFHTFRLPQATVTSLFPIQFPPNKSALHQIQ